MVGCAAGRLDQFTKGFVAINPNSKIPAAVDHAPTDGGAPIRLFESASMMVRPPLDASMRSPDKV